MAGIARYMKVDRSEMTEGASRAILRTTEAYFLMIC